MRKSVCWSRSVLSLIETIAAFSRAPAGAAEAGFVVFVFAGLGAGLRLMFGMVFYLMGGVQTYFERLSGERDLFGYGKTWRVTLSFNGE
jgi:hypothetical protein